MGIKRNTVKLIRLFPLDNVLITGRQVTVNIYASAGKSSQCKDNINTILG